MGADNLSLLIINIKDDKPYILFHDISIFEYFNEMIDGVIDSIEKYSSIKFNDFIDEEFKTIYNYEYNRDNIYAEEFIDILQSFIKYVNGFGKTNLYMYSSCN